jgi:hypothetical protein
VVASYRVADYFLAPIAEPRTYYDAQGVPIFRLTFFNPRDWIIRQEKPDLSLVLPNPNQYVLTWESDWLLRIEPDGSLTEYGDIDENGTLIYVKGHEIKWSDSNGTIWPNLFKSNPKQWGSWGTYLCKPMLMDDDHLDIYMEQKFRNTERAVYHCQKGVGITAITYYLFNGDSATISWKPGAGPIS